MVTASDRDTPRARVAWLSASDGAAPEADVVEAMDAAGYRLSLGAGASPVDVAVIDLAGRRVSLKAVENLAAAVRRAAPECVLIFRADAAAGAAERAHLRRSGELVLATAGPSLLVAAIRNRLRLRNIAEEAGERLKSIAATARLAEFPPIETSPAAPSVLVAGEASPASLAALAAVETVAGRTAGTLTAPQAMRALESADFDCVVLTPSGPNDVFVALARTLRMRRRWQDLPFVVIAPQSIVDAGTWSSPFAADVIGSGQIGEDLAARALSVARRARLAAAMRRFLVACAGDGVRDRLSGAFAPAFFALHAERLLARADATGRPTSIVGVRLAPSGADEQAASARTLTDAARLVKRVTRAEDFLARLTHDTFVALAPATGGDDATLMARRIEGVVAHAMFQSEGGRPFAVAAAAAAFQRPRGARLEEMLAGILSQLTRATPKSAER
jgi:PleD family two-component response regulator